MWWCVWKHESAQLAKRDRKCVFGSSIEKPNLSTWKWTVSLTIPIHLRAAFNQKREQSAVSMETKFVNRDRLLLHNNFTELCFFLRPPLVSLISVTLILVTMISVMFLSKILTFFTQYSELGNTFSTHPSGTNLTKWNFLHIVLQQYPHGANIRKMQKFSKIKNQILPLKPPNKRQHFIKKLLSPFLFTFSDMKLFLHPFPIFSALLNLNFLTWNTPKLKVPKILPGTLSPTQIELIELKISQIDPWNCCTHTFGKGCL